MSLPVRTSTLRAIVLALVAAVALTVGLKSLPAEGQSTLSGKQSRAQTLAAAVAAESAKIAHTQAGLDQAQARYDAIQAQVTARQAQLRKVGSDIVTARTRIERLENRMHEASGALARNLVTAYQNPRPDLVSVVVSAHSFSDLLEDANFMKRISTRDAEVLGLARDTKVQVDKEATRLVALQSRVRRLAADVARKRDQADAVRTALLDVKEQQLARRNGKAAALASVRSQIKSLKARIARQARAARAAVGRGDTAGGAPVPGIATNAGGFAQASAGAPDAVKKVIAAGNAIAGLPYIYGGGHGSFQAAGYDCSASVSYALAAAGLVSSPLDSTGFMSWGEAGPGKYITVYANAGHAYMYVDGWRFDTSALSSGGTRWTRAPRSNAGFVARHPAGL